MARTELKIVCDIDGVVCDLYGWSEITYGKADRTIYSLAERYPKKPISYAMKHSQTFGHLPPVFGARWGLDELYKKGHKVIFCTERQVPYRVTEKWLKVLEIKYFDMYQGEESTKAEFVQSLNPDLVIEDSIEMGEKMKDLGLNVILLGAPYNENTSLPRMGEWREIVEFVERMSV